MSEIKKSVYVLEAIMPKESYSIDNEYDIDSNGEIKCIRELVGVYDDVAKAESDIRKLVQDNITFNCKYDGWIGYFAFVLKEHYLNDTMYGNSNFSSFESIRTYLGNGELNCFSDYDERCDKKFIGRVEPQKFVKDGDYCLMLSGSRIVPILLCKCTPTVDELKKQFPNGYVGDFSDDSGIAMIQGYGHLHPQTPYVFPLGNLKNYVFSDELKSKLKEEQDNYLNGEL